MTEPGSAAGVPAVSERWSWFSTSGGKIRTYFFCVAGSP